MLVTFLLLMLLADDKVAKPAAEAKKLEFNAECSRKPKTGEEAKAPLSPERERARQLIEGVAAEAEAAEPEMKAYLRLRLGRTLSDCAGNKDLARDYFLKALDASRELSDDRNFRSSLQVSIARRLSAETVLQHFSEFSERGRFDLALSIGSELVRTGHHEEAVAFFERFADAPRFPLSAAGMVIEELPADARTERHRIFVAAMQSARLETKPDPARFYDIGALLVDLADTLTPEETLGAADQLLSRAKEVRQTVGISMGDKVFEFPTLYDYRLFQLIPVIRKIDERRAERWLNDAPFVRATLQEHPNGFREINPPSGQPVGPRASWSRTDGKPMDADRVAAEIVAQGKVMALLQQNKVKEAFDYAMNVPTNPSIRLSMLQNVAQQAVVLKEPKLAREALEAALKLIDQLKPQAALFASSRGCEIWMSLQENEKCEALLKATDKPIKTLYETDKSSPDGGNAAFIGYWPSLQLSEELAFSRCKLNPHAEPFEPADDAFRPTIRLTEARCLLGLRNDRWSPQSIPKNADASRVMSPPFF
jgi:hypothetical protein